MRKNCLLSTLMLLVSAGTASAQDAIPSPQHQAEEGTRESQEGETSGSGSAQYSWELPTLNVRGRRASPLREEDRIGSYGQPRWTAYRRFPTTRVYVVPAGKFELEWWNRWDAPIEHIVGSCRVIDLDTGETECEGRRLKSQYELEFGLGHHLQLDLYLQTVQDGPTSPITFDEEKVELRWALADWGVIPGNPTIYLEWARHNADVDFLEAKILLGGELAVGWHWGFNVIGEFGLGGANEKEYQLAGGVSRTIADECLSLGLEAKFALANDEDTDFGHTKEVLGGPSVSWSPVHGAHILFTPLFGVEAEEGESAGIFQGWLIAGWAM